MRPTPRTPRGLAEPLPIEERTVQGALARGAARWGTRPLLRYAGGERSYAEMRDAVARMAGTLCAAGVGPGDRVLTVAGNRVEALDLFLACERLERHGLLAGRPAGAFYILARVGEPQIDTFEFSRRLLTEEHVAVAPGQIFGPSGAGLVRLSLASQAEVAAAGIDRLARFVSSKP